MGRHVYWLLRDWGLMRDDTTFAALLVVQKGGKHGVDCDAFARGYWPEGGKKRDRRHGRRVGRASAGQMRTAAGGTLALLVAAGHLARHGQRSAALYSLTRAGKAFLADYVRKMHEREDAEDVTAGGNPIRSGPDAEDFAAHGMPFPYRSP
jgi:hypothetical protein